MFTSQVHTVSNEIIKKQDNYFFNFLQFKCTKAVIRKPMLNDITITIEQFSCLTEHRFQSNNIIKSCTSGVSEIMVLNIETHLRSTAISFSILLSFPFKAFLGMHFTANIFPVDLSWAKTTSENAPL